MTFWGFLFAVLIVFVALYAWNRFRHTGDAADLGDMMFGNDSQHQRAQEGTRRNDVVVHANRPLLTETGTIGEFDDPIQQAPQVHAQNAGQKQSCDLNTQLFLSEIGSIGDVTREPVALLPAPQGESGARGQMSTDQSSFQSSTQSHGQGSAQNVVQSYGQGTTQASAQEAAQAFTQSSAQDSAQNASQGITQSLAAQEHGYSSAVASESIGSNLSQTNAAWLENSDLERLNNAGNANNRYQGANFDATYDNNAASAGSYMQAQTQSYQNEVGTIGEQQKQNQAPYVESQAQRNQQQRRGYIHKSNVEFGSQADMEGLYNLPDQLPVLNNTNFNDPNCK